MPNNKKYIAIGDIHGCARSLEALLNTLSSYQDRTFVFIGDYIDRGSDSKKVVDLLIEFSSSHECVMLRGNHEQMLLDAIDSGDLELWLFNGGQETLDSYSGRLSQLRLPPEHLQFFNNTRYFYDTPQYLFVHGGIPPDLTVEEALQRYSLHQEFMWYREHLETSQNIWEKKVVFGHTPMSEPLNQDNKIAIDTGCVYSYKKKFSKLTAIKLPEEEFIFQKSLEYLNNNNS